MRSLANPVGVAEQKVGLPCQAPDLPLSRAIRFQRSLHKSKGALDQQVATGARTVTNVAHSARRAADELESDAPQIAGLVRSMANRVEEYSRNLENQSVTDIYQTASDFTRRQPAVVFGVAALAGFFALRTLKSSSTSSGSGRRASRSDEFHGS